METVLPVLKIPKRISELNDPAYNLWWSWHIEHVIYSKCWTGRYGKLLTIFR